MYENRLHSQSCIPPTDGRPAFSAKASAHCSEPHTAPTSATNQELAGTTLDTRPIISWEALSKAGSIQEISGLYAVQGLTFPTEKALLERISKDWIAARLFEFAVVHERPIPKELAVHRVRLPDGDAVIIGIMHALSMHPDVFTLLVKELAKHPFPLAEQNLGAQNLGIFSHGLELPDHLIGGMLPLIAANEVRRFVTLLNIFRRKFPLRKPTAQESKAMESVSETGREIAKIQQMLGIRNRDAALFSRTLLYMPPDLLFESVPTNVRLELLDRECKPYPILTARSAYMAEMLRLFKPEEALRHIRDKIPEEHYQQAVRERAIVCGKGHSAEIEYFLRNGVKDKRVLMAASRDAHRLNDDPMNFMHDAGRRIGIVHAAGYGLAILEGLAVGVGSAWLLGALL